MTIETSPSLSGDELAAGIALAEVTNHLAQAGVGANAIFESLMAVAAQILHQKLPDYDKRREFMMFHAERMIAAPPVEHALITAEQREHMN